MNNELENSCSTNVGFERKSTAMLRHNRINSLLTSARPFNQLGCKTNLQAFSFHLQRFTKQCGVSATMRNKVVPAADGPTRTRLSRRGRLIKLPLRYGN